jgi:hypothetical protein
MGGDGRAERSSEERRGEEVGGGGDALDRLGVGEVGLRVEVGALRTDRRRESCRSHVRTAARESTPTTFGEAVAVGRRWRRRAPLASKALTVARPDWPSRRADQKWSFEPSAETTPTPVTTTFGGVPSAIRGCELRARGVEAEATRRGAAPSAAEGAERTAPDAVE